MTPYYQDDLVTIYHGDCRAILGAIPLVDLVFTSPPYNLGTSVGGAFEWLRKGKKLRPLRARRQAWEARWDRQVVGRLTCSRLWRSR